MNSFEYDDQSVYNPVSLEKHNHGIIKFNSKLWAAFCVHFELFFSRSTEWFV